MAQPTHKYIIKWSKMIATRVRHISLVREDNLPVSFKAGQFITFHIDSPTKILHRSYSIANIPGKDNTVEIALTYVEGGIASKLLFDMQPGDSIPAVGPHGLFILKEEQPARYILIATGTGITPYRSMLFDIKFRLKNNPALEVVVILGVRNPGELLFEEEFLEVSREYPQFKFYACYSREGNANPKPHERLGRIQATLTKICIALDAMGGDYGPSVIVPAAIEALSLHPNLKLILVGKRELLEQELRVHGGLHNQRLIVKAASEMVDMDESPALAMRRKKDSSMRIAINCVKEGLADACVSAGNTGALMAIARFVLKTLPGIDRPAIVYSLPSMTGHVYVLDLGANVDCKAEDLLQFAVMGSVLAMAVDNNPNPTVGLLNVGSEAIKGSEIVKQTAELLTNNNLGINYSGFVEGDDIYKGTADVVVCDGFVGNVALKASEGLVKMVLKIAREEFKRSWYGRLAGLMALPILRALYKRLDPRRYNGASLLGLRGIVIKSHGGADKRAFQTAIQIALLEVEKNIPEKIQKQLAVHLGHSVTA